MITILSFILGIILGLLIAIGRVSKRKILNRGLSVFIELIRGTPLLVQIVYTYYVFPLLADITLKLLGGRYKV